MPLSEHMIKETIACLSDAAQRSFQSNLQVLFDILHLAAANDRKSAGR